MDGCRLCHLPANTPAKNKGNIHPAQNPLWLIHIHFILYSLLNPKTPGNTARPHGPFRPLHCVHCRIHVRPVWFCLRSSLKTLQRANHRQAGQASRPAEALRCWSPVLSAQSRRCWRHPFYCQARSSIPSWPIQNSQALTKSVPCNPGLSRWQNDCRKVLLYSVFLHNNMESCQRNWARMW